MKRLLVLILTNYWLTISFKVRTVNVFIIILMASTTSNILEGKLKIMSCHHIWIKLLLMIITAQATCHSYLLNTKYLRLISFKRIWRQVLKLFRRRFRRWWSIRMCRITIASKASASTSVVASSTTLARDRLNHGATIMHILKVCLFHISIKHLRVIAKLLLNLDHHFLLLHLAIQMGL